MSTKFWVKFCFVLKSLKSFLQHKYEQKISRIRNHFKTSVLFERECKIKSTTTTTMIKSAAWKHYQKARTHARTHTPHPPAIILYAQILLRKGSSHPTMRSLVGMATINMHTRIFQTYHFFDRTWLILIVLANKSMCVWECACVRLCVCVGMNV